MMLGCWIRPATVVATVLFGKMFNYTTSYGQVIIVLHNLTQWNFTYIKDSLKQVNFATANRETTLRGLTELQGHTALRGHAASGEISISLKKDAKLNLIKGSQIFVPNYLQLKCQNNGLPYIIDIGKDYTILDLNSKAPVNFRILQGELEVQTFKGDGTDLQTVFVQSGPQKLIDDEFVVVQSNSKVFNKHISLYDAYYKEPMCMIKNSISGDGIKVVFGRTLNHTVPLNGEEISVNYLVTKGKAGNINNITGLKFTFVDSALDTLGEEINLNEYFDIKTTVTPDFGADGEGMDLTRVIAPNISRNFIIHDKKSIEYFFKKMNYFSVVKVFEDQDGFSNMFDVLLLPRAADRMNLTEDYFNADISKFFLSKEEKLRILQSIQDRGIKSMNINLNLIDPKAKYCGVTIYMDVFETYKNKPTDLNRVKGEIRKLLNDFLLQNDRINKIPQSDLTRILDGQVDECDTVKVIFHTEYKENIDELGNISLGDKEIAIMRGGFIDYNGISIQDSFDPDGEAMGSVNIVLKYSK
jgi:hypothetical protein